MYVQKQPKKVAFVATLYDHLAQFHLPCMNLLQSKGCEVHAFAKKDFLKQKVEDINVICHDINFHRSPFSLNNVKSLISLVTHFKQENFDMVHVHTPVGGVVGRLAARIAKVPVVLYTAHGFHFFKGGPISSWMLFYPVEKLLAQWTDGLITINEEDYNIALQFKEKKDGIYKVNGMGVNQHLFKPKDIVQNLDLKKKFNIAASAKVLITVAECNENKNQIQVVRALALLKDELPEMHYFILGKGNNLELNNEIKRLNLTKSVHFLGYRLDVSNILNIADLFILTSKREGLGLSSIEAMAKGLPIIMTDTVGGRSLIKEGENGFLVPVDDIPTTAAAIKKVVIDSQINRKMYKNNIEKATMYSIDNILKAFDQIYSSYLKN